MALLTIILSIPIVIILQTLLDGYASNYPGSRGFQDDIKEKNDEGKEGEKSENAEIDLKIKIEKEKDKTNIASKLRNSTRESAFGEQIKRGIIKGSASTTLSPSEISQTAYAGKHSLITIHLFDTVSIYFYFLRFF